MFLAIISPIFRSTRLCYSLWYNAPTTLPASSLEVEEQKGHQMAMLSLCDSIAIWWPSCSSASRLPAGNIVSALYHKL